MFEIWKLIWGNCDVICFSADQDDNDGISGVVGGRFEICESVVFNFDVRSNSGFIKSIEMNTKDIFTWRDILKSIVFKSKSCYECIKQNSIYIHIICWRKLFNYTVSNGNILNFSIWVDINRINSFQQFIEVRCQF